MSRSLSLVLTLCLVAPGAAAEKAPAADLNANAALKYWQAFSSLPKFTDEQTRLLEADKPGAPVTDALKAIITSSEDALRRLLGGYRVRPRESA